MAHKKIKKLNWRVLLVMFTYTFITATHILLLSPRSESYFPINSAHNSIFKRKELSTIPVILQLRRIDKCTLDNKSTSFAAIFLLLNVALLFLISFFDALKRKIKFPFRDHSFFNYQYAYLTLCTFRIWSSSSPFAIINKAINHH